MVENVYKRGRYTFAFAHYQVSFGNLRGASPARRGGEQRSAAGSGTAFAETR